MTTNFKKQALKRKVISLETKIQILDRFKTGEGSTLIAKHFGLNEATVRTIKKSEEKIRASVVAGSSVSLKRTSYVRDATMELMEKALIIWIEDNMQNNMPVDGNAIRHKAVKIFDNIKDKQSSSSNYTIEFLGSKGWLEKFKKRYSLHNVNVKGETSALADENAAKEFPKKLSKIIKEGRYTSDQVFNANETGLFWKKIPYVSQTERPTGDRVFVVFCSNASGDCMMKPMVINRVLNPRAMKGLNKKKLPVYWNANKKACVTVTVFRDWFYNYFVSDAEVYMKKRNLNFKVLLLIDNAAGHPTDLYHDNVKVIFLPPNTTSLIQPLDQGIISIFKAYYIKHVLKFFLGELDSDKTLSLTQVWKNFSILDCVKIIKLAVMEINQPTSNACWKSIWPDVVLSGHDIPILENEYSEITRLAHVVGGEGFDHMASTELEELIVNSEFNENELVAIVINSSESESDCDEPVPTLTANTISKGMALAKELEDFFFENDPNMERSSKFGRDLRNCLAQYRELYKKLSKDLKQSLITDPVVPLKNNLEENSEIEEISSSSDEFLVANKKGCY